MNKDEYSVEFWGYHGASATDQTFAERFTTEPV
jgi:hypothetical protein